MIKAVGRTGAGQPMLVLGLSGENMTRLMADEPVLINTDELGHAFSGLPSMSVLLVGGKDEATIAGRLHSITEQPSIVCPVCGAKSYNPNDVREGLLRRLPRMDHHHDGGWRRPGRHG